MQHTRQGSTGGGIERGSLRRGYVQGYNDSTRQTPSTSPRPATTSASHSDSASEFSLPSMTLPSTLDGDVGIGSIGVERGGPYGQVRPEFAVSMSSVDGSHQRRRQPFSSPSTHSPTADTVVPHAASGSLLTSSNASTSPIAASPSSSPRSSSSTSSFAAPVIDEKSRLEAIHSFLRRWCPPDCATAVLGGGDSSSDKSAGTTGVELTPYTVSALDALRRHVDANEQQATVIEEDMKESTKEMQAEAARLSHLLSRLGLSDPTSVLSSSAQKNLDSLVRIAQTLQLKNAHPTTFLLGLLDVRDRFHRSTDSLAEAEQLLADLRRETVQAESMRSELQHLCAARDSIIRERRVEAETKKKQMAYFDTKRKEYEQDTKEIERLLSQSGFDPSISHESLHALWDEITATDESIQPIQRQLDAFQQLPPDLTLARVRVAEAREHLNRLEDEFTQRIRGMQDEEDD